MFRPCIDLHQGRVKQIVGGTLTDDLAGPTTNFISEKPGSWFADLYRNDDLRGGHVIMLGPNNEAAAHATLGAWPGGLQIGGNINASNAKNWIEAGEVFMQFLLSRPEVDPERIVAFGSSFGSFWMTQVAATQPRLKAVATALCCHEPGCYTIFEEASPSYKKRFMWMSDIEDEDEFDRMAAQMDLRPLVPGMKMPWLNIVGEKDELSPVHHTLELAARAGGPSPILMYQGERHALSGASSIVLGPKYMSYAADWLLDRVNGKPAEEFLDLVLADGRIERRPHPRQS